MVNWTEAELREEGYIIENAHIDSVDLSMEDHGQLFLKMVISSGGWGCVCGCSTLGFGYLGSKSFRGVTKATEYLMRIMDVVGVSKFNDLPGHYIRVASARHSSGIRTFGNIIEDKWFDEPSFWEDGDFDEPKH